MSDIVDAAESQVDLGSWSHAGSILTKKKGSISTSTGARWEQATRRANKNSKVLRMRD